MTTSVGPYERPLTLACAVHDCSCSVAGIEFGTALDDRTGFEPYPSTPDLEYSTTSHITLRGVRHSLSAPPLAISVALSPPVFLPDRNNTTGMTASDYWAGAYAPPKTRWSRLGFSLDNSLYSEDDIMSSGVCIANEAYSWGFSSLLLLSFCTYTFLFAATLIILQSEVYQLSRFDRDHQAYSIYADILWIAEALKSIPGSNLLNLLQSPKALDEKLGGRKHGIRFDVSSLPLCRWTGYEKKWERPEEDDRLEDELLSSAEGGVQLQHLQQATEESEAGSATARRSRAKCLALVD
jgi:hypothetical protein